MARLDLKLLECLDTQDVLGADECELTMFADGQLARRVFGVLGTGESLNLSTIQIPFGQAVVAKLHDIDNPAVDDAHDLLGSITIPPASNPSGLSFFAGNGAQYRLHYAVSVGPTPIQPPGRAFLTITSETGVPHSACLFKYANGQEKWFGFKPQVPLSSFGPGFVETASRQAQINHAITFDVADSFLSNCEQLIANHYANAVYQLGVFDCVSLSADVARLCQLRVANVNFTPFGLLAYLREYNTFSSYV